MRQLATITAAAALVVAFGFATGAIAFRFDPSGKVIVVNDNAAGRASERLPCNIPPDHTNIQDAINVASPGDNILVCTGNYEEDLEIFVDDLTLLALSNGPPIIQGVASNAAAGFPTAVPNIDLQANGVTIEGFIIRGPALGAGEYSSGLIIDGVNNAILRNRFQTYRGSPGSVTIQTWALTIGSEGIRDISGLLIANNSFTHRGGGSNLGYAGVFINPQTDPVDEGNPVRILNNVFGGRLYRAVGVARSHTDVSGNNIRTVLKPSDEPIFGGPIPLGIKLFGGVDSVWVSSNRIKSISTKRFARGITVQDGASDNVLLLNNVTRSVDFDCLDESADGGFGTDGTDNTWINNGGKKRTPAGICR